MNNEDTNLDLLDLDDGASDSLPEVAFVSPRPKKPWLLLSVGLVVIALATYVIVKTVGGNSSSSVEIDLDAAPEVIVDGGEMPMPTPMPDANPQPLPMPPAPMPMPAPDAQPKPMPAPVAEAPKPVQVMDAEPNVRVVQDRREVTFNPNKEIQEPKPVVKKAEPKPAAKPVAKKAAVKPVPKKVEKSVGTAAWYVQFGSYSSRDAANAAGQKMRAAHSSLFAGKQFVVLASVLKDGRTTYRLRVAFNSSNEANGFCRNAKSDGLDCYVAK